MKKFPLIILTPIPISWIGTHYKASENTMIPAFSMKCSKYLSNSGTSK